MSNSLENDIRYLKGVGPKKAEVFRKLNITTPKDLLFFFPRRYEDRCQFKLLKDLQVGDFVTIKGRITRVLLKNIRKNKNP